MATTVVTFVGLMVFGWGMDITGRTNTQSTGGELGRVNGQPITFEEWNTQVRNLTEQQQRASNAPINAVLSKQIEQEAWEQLVMQKLVNQELDRRGIGVTNAEVLQMARYAPPQEFMSNPMFQTDGQFDLTKYHNFLATPQANDELLLQLEAYYRDVIPRSKLFYQTTAGTYLPEGELWRMWRDTHEKAKVRYIYFDPATLIPDARVTVQPREVERYYREHEDEFTRPAHARVRLVTIDRRPNAADTAAALARVQRVRQEIVGGAKFEDVARRESADSVSAVRGGELGKLRRGQTFAAFDTALFSLPLNRLSEPIKSQAGYHLIEVKSRTGDEAEARHILIPIELTPERDNALLTLADSLDDLGARGSLDAAARTLNLVPRTTDLSEDMTFLPGVGQAEEGAAWVLDDAEVGEVSEVFETPGAYYIVEVLEKTPAGKQTLDDARAAITARLTAEKKLEAAREVARQAADALARGNTLEQAAQSVGLKVEEAGPFTRTEFAGGLGRANAATGTAFGLNPGQVSPVVEAEGALFIIQGVERTPASREEFEKDKATQGAQLTRALSQQRWNQFLQAMRADAKIVDNRQQLLTRQTSTAN